MCADTAKKMLLLLCSSFMFHGEIYHEAAGGLGRDYSEWFEEQCWIGGPIWAAKLPIIGKLNLKDKA